MDWRSLHQFFVLEDPFDPIGKIVQPPAWKQHTLLAYSTSFRPMEAERGVFDSRTQIRSALGRRAGVYIGPSRNRAEVVDLDVFGSNVALLIDEHANGYTYLEGNKASINFQELGSYHALPTLGHPKTKGMVEAEGYILVPNSDHPAHNNPNLL